MCVCVCVYVCVRLYIVVYMCVVLRAFISAARRVDNTTSTRLPAGVIFFLPTSADLRYKSYFSGRSGYFGTNSKRVFLPEGRE